MLERWWATLRRSLPLATGLAAFGLLTAPVLHSDVQLFYRDTGRLYYPIKQYIAERLRAGHLPLWDPWTEAGVSLLGQMSPGLLHPWTLLYLVFPFDLAFKLNHLLPLVLAGVGAALLTRRLGGSPAAYTLAGVVFGACGYLVSQAASNLIFVTGPAGVPLALERWIATLDSPSRPRLLAASALLALCAYAGEPQSMLMCGLIGAAFAIARALSRSENVVRAAALVAAWGALGLALSAPVALPAAYQLTRSSRAAGLSAFEQTRFSVSPLRIPGLFVPHAFDDVPEVADTIEESKQLAPFTEYLGNGGFAPSIYLGAAAILLAGFAVFAGRRGRFFLLGAVILTLAATGEELGLQHILQATIPGYRVFRYAEKQMAFASLLYAVAAGLGLDAAFAGRRRLVALAASAGGAAAALGALASFFRRDPPALHAWLIEHGSTHSPHPAETFIRMLGEGTAQEAQLVALLFAAALASLLLRRFPGRAVAVAACSVAVVLSGTVHLPTIPVEFFHDTPPLARELVGIAGPSAGRWRLYTRPDSDIPVPFLDPKRAWAVQAREPLRPQYSGLYGIEGVGDYFSASDVAYAAFMEGDPRDAFDLLTVRFFLVLPRSMSDAHAKDIGFRRTYFDMWLLTLPPRPRARLMDRVEEAASVPAIGKRMREVDATRTAIFLPGEAPKAVAVTPAAAVPQVPSYRRLDPEHIHVDVDAAVSSVLEVGEHYDRGWRVRVDGRNAPTLAVDGALLGTVVPAGRHAVDLRYWPTGSSEGIAIAIAAIAIVLVTRRVRGLTFSVRRGARHSAENGASRE